jgi:hypothetical protein
MEADISIWQKPGHFYFALTPIFCNVLERPNSLVASRIPLENPTSEHPGRAGLHPLGWTARAQIRYLAASLLNCRPHKRIAARAGFGRARALSLTIDGKGEVR